MKRIYILLLLTVVLSSCGWCPSTNTPFKSCGGGSNSPTGASLVADFLASSPASNSVSLQKNRISGDTVYLDVKATGVNGVFGASIKFNYDATKVKWGGTHETGNFLEGGGSSPTYQVALDGSTGEGKLVVGVALSSGTPVSGNGTIVTIPFKVIASGNTNITFSGDSKLTDNASPVPSVVSVTSWDGGTVKGQ